MSREKLTEDTEIVPDMGHLFVTNLFSIKSINKGEKVIDIETLREYFNRDTIIISEHAKNRCRERNIKQKDVKNCIMTGEIIEQYPEDFPFPSCLVFGYATDNKIIHAVISSEGECGRIITAYIPNTNIFENDLKTRKER